MSQSVGWAMESRGLNLTGVRRTYRVKLHGVCVRRIGNVAPHRGCDHVCSVWLMLTGSNGVCDDAGNQPYDNQRP